MGGNLTQPGRRETRSGAIKAIGWRSRAGRGAPGCGCWPRANWSPPTNAL